MQAHVRTKNGHTFIIISRIIKVFLCFASVVFGSCCCSSGSCDHSDQRHSFSSLTEAPRILYEGYCEWEEPAGMVFWSQAAKEYDHV